MITALGIKSALAEAKRDRKDVFISDDSGQRVGWRLVLRCQPTGSASCCFGTRTTASAIKSSWGNLSALDMHAARAAAQQHAEIYKDTTDVQGKLDADDAATAAACAAEEAKAAAEAQVARTARKVHSSCPNDNVR